MLYYSKMDSLHYYGDTVRKFFLVGSAFMLITLPTFQSVVPASIYVSILAALGATFVAGALAPDRKWVALFSVFVAAAATGIFEYYAANAALGKNFWFFVVNQILALNFLTAFYYSTKTLRGMMSQRK